MPRNHESETLHLPSGRKAVRVLFDGYALGVPVAGVGVVTAVLVESQDGDKAALYDCSWLNGARVEGAVKRWMQEHCPADTRHDRKSSKDKVASAAEGEI